MMSNWYRKLGNLSVFLMMIGIIVSCGSSRQTTTRGTDSVSDTPSASAVDESFDPMMLQDEDLSFPEKEIPTQSANMPALPGENMETEEVAENQVVDGYRVQIFATQSIENATLQKKEAEYVFVADSVALYIEFDSPMYKIRVGDCLSRADAENLLEISRRHGYPTSFVVKTKVNTVPVLYSREDIILEEQ